MEFIMGFIMEKVLIMMIINTHNKYHNYSHNFSHKILVLIQDKCFEIQKKNEKRKQQKLNELEPVVIHTEKPTLTGFLTNFNIQSLVSNTTRQSCTWFFIPKTKTRC